MKTVAGIAIFLILVAVLAVTIKDDAEKMRLLEYRVLGKHTDGNGELVYTIEVRTIHTKVQVFFGNISANDFHTQPLSNNRWNTVPERDYPLYQRQ